MGECFVYLPVYNGEKFLKATLDSILAQDYPDFKIIIYDDCSTDRSDKIIRAYAEEYPERIVYQRNKHNLGVGTTLYNCYEAYHSARYFAQIGHDDVWEPDYLSKQIKALSGSDALVAFARTEYIGSDGRPRKDIDIFAPELINSLDREELFLRLLQSNFLCAPASVVDISRIDAEEATSYWGYNNERLQDCELWLNLALHGKLLYNASANMHYRVHGNNLSDSSRHVLQGRLEYYTMLQRVLFSPAFDRFYQGSDNPEWVIDELLDTMARNVSYSNPVKLLMINLCERFLNSGYETEKLWTYLNWLYMDSGIILKCMKNHRKLTAPIQITLGGTIRAKETVQSLEETGNFNVNSDMNSMNPGCLCITQEDNLEYLLNWPQFYYNYINGQVLVMCREENLESTQSQHPHTLCLKDDIKKDELEKLLYAFVEDKTHLYRNGFFDMQTGYGYPDTGFHKIVVMLEKNTSVRAVRILDRSGDELTFMAGGAELSQIASDQAKTLLEENEVADGELTVKSRNGIFLRDRIVVNNLMYICVNVVMGPDHEIVPVFRPLSYFNNSMSEAQISNSELQAKCNALETQLTEITTSLTYVTCIKLKKLLARLKILQPIKRLILKLRKRFLYKL